MKIVATLGPASKDSTVITGLAKFSDRFRLNSSHMNSLELKSWLSNINNTPVVIDLKGAKYRVGVVLSSSTLPDEVEIFFGGKSDKHSQIPVPDRAFFTNIKSGDIIHINDAKIKLEVMAQPVAKGLSTIDRTFITARVLTNGSISSFKGINKFTKSGEPVASENISEKDLLAINTALEFDFTEFAYSFVYDGNEAEFLRPLIKNHRLIAKVERKEAMQHLENIDKNFDELWFCRGDMGAEVGLNNLGQVQEDFIASFPKLTKPKYIAGRIMERLDFIGKGFDGLVLSDETAIGETPLSSAEFFMKYRNNKEK